MPAAPCAQKLVGRPLALLVIAAAVDVASGSGSGADIRSGSNRHLRFGWGEAHGVLDQLGQQVVPHNRRALEEIEREHILAVLEGTGWRVSGEGGAARLLGMKPTTLEARMKKLGITRRR